MTRSTFPRLFLLGALAAGAAACAEDKIASVPLQPASTLYWGLRNDIKAVTVAVGGQQQLTVTPVTASGTAIPDLPTPTFSSADTMKVKVSASGLITGVAATRGVPVIASLTGNGITYVDTTLVAVTPASAVLDSLDLGLPPGSATLGAGDSPSIMFPTAFDDQGQPIPGVAISLEVSNPNVLAVRSLGGPALMQPMALGKTSVVASATAYGITKVDTVEFTVQYGMTATVHASVDRPGGPVTFSPPTALIGVGGTVTWANYSPNPIDVTFDGDVSHIEGGNIPTLGRFQQASRRFTAAGTYTYKDSTTGATGTIIVRVQPTF